MKKISTLILVISIFLLVGCGKKEAQKETKASKETIVIQPPTTNYKETKLTLPSEVEKVIHMEKVKEKVYVSTLNHQKQSVIYSVDEIGGFHDELLVSTLVSEPSQLTYLGKNGELFIVPSEGSGEEEQTATYLYTTTIDQLKELQKREVELDVGRERIQVVTQDICVISDVFGESKLVDLAKSAEKTLESEGGIYAITNNGKDIYTQTSSDNIQITSKENEKVRTLSNLSSVLGGICDEYVVEVHPVNQSGASSKEVSDLDIYKSGSLFLCNELKHKTFTDHDIRHAADKVLAAGKTQMHFIAGRSVYYDPNKIKPCLREYQVKGFLINVIPVDYFVPTLLSLIEDVDVDHYVKYILQTAIETKFKEETIAFIRNTAAKQFGV
ncbi:hypothetical protein Hs30E_08730 [Lactococcus hodotermopsidis]|uniref:Uncharacterized protein n=1 Tax=Pseudolactococcus hodotermopsidis TaxID=2709157 RepID=A0A6A0BAA7_9LACT|nr:restriction endonuclease, SacI family [Lactococcus hodotermopsidis]GFH42322.1 hypothetical protein Hs30E_08730 [Lactococcus hodotermopsidis]